MAQGKKTADWKSLTDEEIVNLRVRDLDVRIEGSALEPVIERLYEELVAKGIRFRPPCYLADEWLCPDRVPIIGIPFCLADERLMDIEMKMMYEVEGGTEKSCVRLLRHEAGHAINYAYELYKKTRWRELFGRFSERYGDAYYYQPYSRRYVIHLEDSYAQAHPDEDFAETFAVWLGSENNWREKYRDWPVMKKLQYVDGLMKRIGDTEPIVKVDEAPPWSASRMRSTLAVYYERKRKTLGSEFRGFYDDSLKQVFTARYSGRPALKASVFLRRNRRELVNSVTAWTGHRKYDIYQLVNRLIERCDALGLWARRDNIIGISTFVATIASNTNRITRRL